MTYVTLHTRQDGNFEHKLHETSRQTGVPADRLRKMVAAFNAAVFTPPETNTKGDT